MPTINMPYKPQKESTQAREIAELTEEGGLPRVLGMYYNQVMGKTLYDAVLEKEPKTIIEFGTGDGFTTLCMAAALKEMDLKVSRTAHFNRIYTYDLFDPSIRSPKSMVEEYTKMGGEIERLQVDKYIELGFQDFYKWIETADHTESFDLLYVDVGNTAKTIKLLREKLPNHIKNGATILFEGGSEKRDRFTGSSKNGYWRRCKNHAGISKLKDELMFEVLSESQSTISKLINE
jgi:predicted O-methyltransferase YrrM